MEDLKKYLYLGKKCNCCGRTYKKEEKQYYCNERYSYYKSMGTSYKKHDHIELDTCKDCIKLMIDMRDTETIISILECLNVPFIIEEWDKIVKFYNYNKTCLGRYLSKMQLASFRDYTYKDSNMLNERYKERKQKLNKL